MTTLKDLMSDPLATVEWKYRNGFITETVYLEYLHAWQTCAPRFELNVCKCTECKRGTQ